MQLVEGVEELFLHSLLVAEELDIVNEQHVGVPVFVVEQRRVVVVDAGDQVVAELFAGHVNDLVVRVVFVYLVGDGVH